jgi:hypothetical protein
LWRLPVRLSLTLAAVAVAANIAPADDPKKDDTMKKHELKVTFATPTPGFVATITEARVVGNELWVKVDLTPPDGVVPQVISKVTAEKTVEAADLPVKYAVFGKTWKWKNEEKDITFADDVGKEEKEKWEKAWKDGKVAFEAKKK